MSNIHDDSLPTLKEFLKLLLALRHVICQDVAEMMNNGDSHVLFNLPVFCVLILGLSIRRLQRIPATS